MNKVQTRLMSNFGFAVEEVRTKAAPRISLMNKDGVVMTNLPADEHNLRRYLARGFKPISEMTKMEPPQADPVLTQDGFRCPICEKVLSSNFALAGHSRKHKE